jgi:hypothetical protein
MVSLADSKLTKGWLQASSSCTHGYHVGGFKPAQAHVAATCLLVCPPQGILSGSAAVRPGAGNCVAQSWDWMGAWDPADPMRLELSVGDCVAEVGSVGRKRSLGIWHTVLRCGWVSATNPNSRFRHARQVLDGKFQRSNGTTVACRRRGVPSDG